VPVSQRGLAPHVAGKGKRFAGSDDRLENGPLAIGVASFGCADSHSLLLLNPGVGYGYTFVATNPGSRPLQLEISDRIPVSEVEEVEVHLDDGTTPGYRLARDDGVLRWKVDVPPGKSSTVELRYHLDVHGEVDLSGL